MSSVFEIIIIFFIHYLKIEQNEEKFSIFFFLFFVFEELIESTQSNLSWLSNSVTKGGGGIFGPHLHLFFFSFFFALPSSLFSLPPLSLFTLFFYLHFLPHFTISSLENHFPKFLNLLSLCSWPLLLQTIFLKPVSKPPIFFALIMASSKRPSFLTFNGKKISPITWMEWGKGLLQDPKIHALHSKMDFKVCFIFWISLLGNLLISCFVRRLVLRHCHLVVICSRWNFVLYGWSCCNVGLGAFMHCWAIWHGVTWTMLMTHEIWLYM